MKRALIAYINKRLRKPQKMRMQRKKRWNESGHAEIENISYGRNVPGKGTVRHPSSDDKAGYYQS